MNLPLDPFPEELHTAITDLSKDICFDGYSEKGQNGFVLFGTNKVMKRQVAIKIYYWGGGMHVEPELLAKLRHENILEIYHAATINDDYAFYSTKFCDGGDLDAIRCCRQLGVKEAVELTSMVAAGVSFLHGHNYLHRDLKPENIYWDGDKAVVGDFGSVVACDATGYCKTWTRHSLLYRPPEATDVNDYYKTSDVYQLGILLYQLSGGFLPYDERDWLTSLQKLKYDSLQNSEKEEFAAKIIEKRINSGRLVDISTLPDYVPDTVRSIIRKATKVKRLSRYSSVADLLAKLNNVKGALPDWRIEGDPTLYRGSKKVRIRVAFSAIVIEKDVGSGWRQHHSHGAKTMAEAVIVAETL